MQWLRGLILTAGICCAGNVAHASEPDWGQPSEGFVVALKLDKSTYTVNDDINAYVDCTRLTSGWKEYGYLWATDKCSAQIEVRDEKGALVPLNDEERRRIRGGGPVGTTIYKKGKILTDEIIINKEYLYYFVDEQGFFVSRPGTFTATAIWMAPSKDPKVYTVVYSKPVSFHVTEK